MFSSMLMLMSGIAVITSFRMVTADHIITLTNNCNDAVPVWVDSAPGSVAYTGFQPGTIAAHSSQDVTVPTGWNSRICRNADGNQCADGVTTESMIEFNTDVGSPALDSYDISNIRGYTVAQSVRPHMTSQFGGCQTTSCSDPNCPCDQAYPLGNEAGCGVVLDSPVKSCPSGDFTITYCP